MIFLKYSAYLRALNGSASIAVTVGTQLRMELRAELRSEISDAFERARRFIVMAVSLRFSDRLHWRALLTMSKVKVNIKMLARFGRILLRDHAM